MGTSAPLSTQFIFEDLAADLEGTTASGAESGFTGVRLTNRA